MWTRGKDKHEAGKFEIEIFGCAGDLVLRQGGFATASDADRAAEVAQRNVLFGYAPEFVFDPSDDALLAELLA